MLSVRRVINTPISLDRHRTGMEFDTVPTKWSTSINQRRQAEVSSKADYLPNMRQPPSPHQQPESRKRKLGSGSHSISTASEPRYTPASQSQSVENIVAKKAHVESTPTATISTVETETKTTPPEKLTTTTSPVTLVESASVEPKLTPTTSSSSPPQPTPLNQIMESVNAVIEPLLAENQQLKAKLQLVDELAEQLQPLSLYMRKDILISGFFLLFLYSVFFAFIRADQSISIFYIIRVK